MLSNGILSILGYSVQTNRVEQSSGNSKQYFEKEYRDNVHHNKSPNIFESTVQDEKIERCDMSDPKNINHIGIFDTGDLYDAILGKKLISTNDRDEKIMRQFMADFSRTNIVINSKPIKTIDSFFLELAQYNRQLMICNQLIRNQPISLMMFCMAVICQQTLYCSYARLHFKMERFKEQLEKDQMTHDKRLEYHLTDYPEKNTIELYIDLDKFLCFYRAIYQIKDITNNQTIRKISSETIFSTNEKNGLIIYSVVD